MAKEFLFANNASSTLAADLTAIATTLTLNAGDGDAKFPSPGVDQEFQMTLVDDVGNIEVVACTSRTIDSCTIVRAQDGTSALAFVTGNRAELRLAKGALQNIPQKSGNVQVDLNADLWDGGNKIVSVSPPSGGADGDVWFEREA